MKQEGAVRFLKVVGLLVAAAAVLLALQFLLNVTGGERPDVGVGTTMTTRFEGEELS
ncbi:MAG: hypothetical protein PF508_07690 [Spirochaeta sp.]|jgi:hypothetical protein|nr:hypothetical protein [Spirochaeta sp.]